MTDTMPRWPLDDYVELVEEYRVCRDSAKDWSDKRDAKAKDLKKLLDDRDGLGTVDGEVVVRVSSYDRPSIDTTWLKDHYPEIWHAAARNTKVTALYLTDRES